MAKTLIGGAGKAIRDMDGSMLAANFTRRSFLKGVAAASACAVGGPYVVPASVFGANGGVVPNSRITMGCIGLGGQSSGKRNVAGLPARAMRSPWHV